MATKNKKLIIIDGNALIHRSFHALPPTLKTKDGLLVNAVYGFTSFLLKALLEFKPTYIVLTLDRKAPTFRHVAYTEYKATRTKAPDELYEQIPLVKEIAEAFNIPIFELDGFEADDLIGTICAQVNPIKNIDKIIITGDMDTLQLVNKNTSVYTMSRGLNDTVIYNEAKVYERYQLHPNQIIDYKALRGDPSDNIPGVRGIGEKTATELLINFKNLDGVYQSVEKNETKTSPRILELLKEHKKEAYLSQDLATIHLSAPIKLDLEKLNFTDFDLNKVFDIFTKFEFRSLLGKAKDLHEQIKNNAVGHERVATIDTNSRSKGIGKIQADSSVKVIEQSAANLKNEESNAKFTRNAKDFNYHKIDNDKDFKNFLKKLKTAKAFTFDVETTSLDPITTDLLGISFSWTKNEAYFLVTKPINLDTPLKNNSLAADSHVTDLFNYQTAPDKSTKKSAPISKTARHAWLNDLAPIFSEAKIKKHGHNLKFDTRVLEAQGLIVKGLAFDTMIASYLLNPDNRQHNLDALTFTELGFEKISKNNLLGQGKDKSTWREVDLDKLASYSCEDADFTERLVKKLAPKLKTEKLEDLFNKIEMPLIDVLADMENNGIKVNKNFLKKLDKDLSERLKKLETKIYKAASQKFNINSTKQLKEILFVKLKISSAGIKKTKTGFSTAEDELNKLWELHPIIPLLKDYRELNKLLSTYIHSLPNLINPQTGRIHTNYNQTVAATGRLSSNDPNLQNIPTKTEEGKKVREAFIAQTGYKLVSFDYSQIELRLVADMARDKTMIQAFRDNKDIHTITAAAINAVKLEDVTKKMRSEAKAINFGIIYGQGPHGLSQNAGIPYTQAHDFIEKYFLSYPSIKKFMDATIKSAQENGYVNTLFGRRRPLADINSQMIMVRRSAERMAINTPIQGTAADLIKMAMIKIHDLIKNKPEEIKMLLQVHDELIFEIKSDKVESYLAPIKDVMENVIKLKVPIIAEYSIGDNWGELK